MSGSKKEIKMSNRAEILSRIKANKPALTDLPKIEVEIFTETYDLSTQFKKMIKEVGGTIFSLNSKSEIIDKLSNLYPAGTKRYSTLLNSESYNTIDVHKIQKSSELEDIDVLVLEGEFGVAENGAIWLSDESIPVRVLPFITKHLVLVLHEKNIVTTQHHAYEYLKNIDTGFGLFISGPSKTADIEQSLVIGAQGALSLMVLLYNK